MQKQIISDTIDILTAQSCWSLEFEGTKLYGKLLEEKDDLHSNCKVYKLSNETGTGEITAHQVFTGIELYYNDMHMSYCNQNQDAIKNMIEINHCCIGRYECDFGSNGCCYLSAGDLAIGSGRKKKAFSSFPLNHYHGITIILNLDKLLPEIHQIMKLLNINLKYIQEYICEDNRLCIIRANPSIEHIFSELYHVPEQRKSGYMKIKILELLLFLSDLNEVKEVTNVNYYNQKQVKLIKKVAAFITKDLSKHYTIYQLSEKFGVSTSTLKKYFRGVYGTSIYAYLRTYRLQTAQKMLMETQLQITEIANKIGYENPNKFSSAFRKVYGISPTEFRKSVLLDRK